MRKHLSLLAVTLFSIATVFNYIGCEILLDPDNGGGNAGGNGGSNDTIIVRDDDSTSNDDDDSTGHQGGRGADGG